MMVYRVNLAQRAAFSKGRNLFLFLEKTHDSAALRFHMNGISCFPEKHGEFIG